MMILKIGNIEPKETVKIEIGYIEELSLTLNTFYKFTLPIKMSPRFFNSIPKISLKNSFKKSVAVNHQSFSWDFNLRVRSSRKIISQKSSSHSIKVLKTNDTNTDVSLTFENGHILDKDFVFTYTTE